MIAAGVPVVPGTEQPLQSAEEAVRICNEIGYPVMLKASMGGGGKGMRLIHSEDEVVEAYNTCLLYTSNLKSVIIEPGCGMENLFDYMDDRPYNSNYATLTPGRSFYISPVSYTHLYGAAE